MTKPVKSIPWSRLASTLPKAKTPQLEGLLTQEHKGLRRPMHLRRIIGRLCALKRKALLKSVGLK